MTALAVGSNQKGTLMRSQRYAARAAGFMFLFLIATDIASSVLIGGVEGDEISETRRDGSGEAGTHTHEERREVGDPVLPPGNRDETSSPSPASAPSPPKAEA